MTPPLRVTYFVTHQAHTQPACSWYFAYFRAYMHARACTHVHAHAWRHSHICEGTCAYMRTRTHAPHTHILTRTRTHIHIYYSRARARTRSHAHTHKHSRLYTSRFRCVCACELALKRTLSHAFVSSSPRSCRPINCKYTWNTYCKEYLVKVKLTLVRQRRMKCVLAPYTKNIFKATWRNILKTYGFS